MPTGLGRSVGVGLVVIAAFPISFWAIATYVPSRQAAWVLEIALLVGFMGIVGWVLTGRALGILIDDRNRYGLARLQTVIWTVVVLSAFGLMVFHNLATQPAGSDPFNVAVPSELWIALGITVVSLAGTPIIRGVKSDTDNKPRPDVAQRTLERLGKVQPGLSDAAFTFETAPMLTGVIVRNSEASGWRGRSHGSR